MKRVEYIKARDPKLFDTEREDKLPVWARQKLHNLRMVLIQEAHAFECAQAEIERLEMRPSLDE
jgi:hypothetical protein